MLRNAITAVRGARRGSRLVFSVLLTLGTVIGVSLAAQPAQAANTPPGAVPCPAGDLCWWTAADQHGVEHPVRDAIYSWTTQREDSCSSQGVGGPFWNDCASTLLNNKAGYGAQVYANAYPEGGSPSSSDPGYCLEPGSQVALDLTKVHYSNAPSISLNDTISANRWRNNGC